MESLNILAQAQLAGSTHHAGPAGHSRRPVLVLPPEERGEGHDDRHQPDAGDQHPDGAGASAVDVVRIRNRPVSAITQLESVETFKLFLIICQ